MKPEQMRIKIAEACGWKFHGVINGLLLMFPPTGGDAWCPPKYPKSHDAMAEARKTLNVDEIKDYLFKLKQVCGFDGDDGGTPIEMALIKATPLQHAEAFLRAKGLWEEGE